MIRMIAVSLLMSGALVVAQEPGSFKLAAPAGWGGESINLPQGFAPDMKLQGSEHIRFAPGMMKPESDSFFSYTFMFELQTKPVLTESVVKEEFLKYYRGLCKAVLNGKFPDVDPSGFSPTKFCQELLSHGRPCQRGESLVVDRPLRLRETPAPFTSQSPGIATHSGNEVCPRMTVVWRVPRRNRCDFAGARLRETGSRRVGNDFSEFRNLRSAPAFGIPPLATRR